jgi:hypothetical protein
MIAKLVRVLPLVLLVPLAGCDKDDSSLGEQTANDTEIPSDGVAPTANDFATTLGDKSLYWLSPEGYAHGAHEVYVDVETVTVPEGSEGPAFGQVAQAQVTKAVKNYAYDSEFASSPFRLMDQGGDMYHRMAFGWQDGSVRQRLLSLVLPSKRSAVERLIYDPDGHGYYFHFMVYDLGAEFVGTDLFMFVPIDFGSDESANAVVLTVETSYY